MSLPRIAAFALLLLPQFAAAENGPVVKLGRLDLRPLPTSSVQAASSLRQEATPSTVWLDFRALAANRWIPGDLPDWLGPVTAETAADANGVTRSTFLLRFRGLLMSSWGVQCRLFFDDQKNAAPVVVAWSNLGAQRFTFGPLGSGLGLPNSETFHFPAAGTSRLDVTVPGDGRTVRGVFLALLSGQEVRHGLDFAPPSELLDPFGSAPLAITQAADRTLFGRVKATIDPDGLKLTPAGPSRGTWEFPLEAPPLLAVLTFEVLNIDALAPLDLTLNGCLLGPAPVQMPDLADPGYLGLARGLEKDLRFRYTGWLRAQKIIPASALRAGPNTMTLQLHPDSGPLAVRAVEIELKYPWKSLDYTLDPGPP